MHVVVKEKTTNEGDNPTKRGNKFVTRNWTEVNDLSSSQYFATTNIRFKIPMLNQICVIIMMHILL